MSVENLPFVLASGSPRRQELLSSIGVKFIVLLPDIDEIQLSGEEPADSVRRLSREKAQSVATQLAEPSIVLSADTVVVFVDGDDQKILNKPADDDHARQMLRSLRGKDHFVYTGVTLVVMGLMPIQITTSVQTTVRMRNFADNELEAYVATGEPLDKAGGYAIQDPNFKLVDSIEGSYTNVVGLPLEKLQEILQQIDYPFIKV